MQKIRVISLAATTALFVFCAAFDAPAAKAAEAKTETVSVPELPNVDKLIYGEVSYPDSSNGESSAPGPEDDSSKTIPAAVPELPSVDKLLSDPALQTKVIKPGEKTGISVTAISIPKLSNAPKQLSPIAQIKLLYTQGKYRDCLNIIESGRPSELTHYYAGLCYQGQGQLSRANSEFQWAASYAKDPLIRYNAQMALQSVSSYAKSRTYAGQGNNFARTAGGGRGAVRRG